MRRALFGSRVFVSGGTGSFGHAFVRYALDNLDPAEIVIYSRDEFKHASMRETFGDNPRIRGVIGDVRDEARLRRAMAGAEYVIHAAALKRADASEAHAGEFIRTNILGSENIISAAIDAGVKSVVALSSDKACQPVNLYGASKLCTEKLFISANGESGNDGTRFSAVRYGNVLGTRGSVVPLFRELARNQQAIPITDKRMTRFWMTLDGAVEFVVSSFDLMRGGEVFIPRLPSMRVTDLAEAIAPGSPTVEIGMRPGEKLHEEMISPTESFRSHRLKDRMVILPAESGPAVDESTGFDRVPDGYSYRSDTNGEWLSVEELRALVA
ncbi:UDP-N-acetylglucosamine 4,6-dehydratase (inverting) [Streptomyces sp. NPDC052107]|uniref:UDP-N-acetylglucosamine 4,6-dehydratase (inverting) n=1 Tax=Streptomyces sp. NPDC052107 TaxID=3155632 RepID=UPI003435B680